MYSVTPKEWEYSVTPKEWDLNYDLKLFKINNIKTKFGQLSLKSHLFWVTLYVQDMIRRKGGDNFFITPPPLSVFSKELNRY